MYTTQRAGCFQHNAVLGSGRRLQNIQPHSNSQTNIHQITPMGNTLSRRLSYTTKLPRGTNEGILGCWSKRHSKQMWISWRLEPSLIWENALISVSLPTFSFKCGNLCTHTCTLPSLEPTVEIVQHQRKHS